VRIVAALAVVLTGAVVLASAVTRGDGGDDATPPRPEDVLGGLVTLVEDDPLGCLGDTSLPQRDVGDDLDAIADRVSELRDLSFTEGVEHRFLDREQMADLVRERFGGYRREDAARDIRLLSALGAAPASADLRELRVDVFAEQVSGLHIGDDGRVWIRVDDPPDLRPLEQVVAAHELQHAVADQQLGRPRQAREGDEDADQRLASRAVVEGDAALTMHLFAQTSLTAQEREDLRAQLRERAAEGGLAAYPHYLRNELRFPYVEGKDFVCARYADGGWEAVDALYTDPPESSAAILFPERYGEEPVAPQPLAGPGGRWERERDDTFGAAQLLWLFRAPGDDPDRSLDDPRAASGGWDGGRVGLWTQGPRSVVGLAFTQRPGEADLCASVSDWYRAAFPTARYGQPAGDEVLAAVGGSQTAVVTCPGDEVRVGIAPNLDLARRTVEPSR
jgi:hypothetical protein